MSRSVSGLSRSLTSATSPDGPGEAGMGSGFGEVREQRQGKRVSGQGAAERVRAAGGVTAAAAQEATHPPTRQNALDKMLQAFAQEFHRPLQGLPADDRLVSDPERIKHRRLRCFRLNVRTDLDLHRVDPWHTVGGLPLLHFRHCTSSQGTGRSLLRTKAQRSALSTAASPPRRDRQTHALRCCRLPFRF